MNEHAETASAIHRNAQGLLSAKGIHRILKDVGELYFTGSYALDLMTWNDIDMQLVTREGVTPFDALMTFLGHISKDAGFLEGQLVNFKGGHKPDMPRGLYLGVKLHDQAWGGLWKLDLWVLEQADFEKNRSLIDAIRSNLTPGTRDLILTVKHAMMAGQGRVPPKASHTLYRLVLFEGIRNLERLYLSLADEGVPTPSIVGLGELELSVFMQWRQQQQAAGALLVAETFQEIADRWDVCFLVNQVRGAAYAHYLRPDVKSKPHTVTAKADRDGCRDGFVSACEAYQRKPLSFNILGSEYLAVMREGRQLLVRSPRPSDDLIETCCCSMGCYLVSDVDLVSIGARGRPAGTVVRDPELGLLTPIEKEIIEDLNALFRRKKLGAEPEAANSTFNLVAHGPADRLPEAKLERVHYPLVCYAPSRVGQLPGAPVETLTSPLELASLLEKLQGQGYDLGSTWRSTDVSGL